MKIEIEKLPKYLDSISRKDKLTKVDLRLSNLGHKGAVIIANWLVDAPEHVFSIDLSDNSFGSEGATEIARALGDNRNIKIMNLSYNEIGSAGASAVARALLDNYTLRSIDLTCNSITAEGLSDIARALLDNSTLTSINLSGNNIQSHQVIIGDEGVSAIAKMLSNGYSLFEINLGFNRLGDEAVSEIAWALSTNSTLTSIDLSNNTIGDKGASAIAYVLENLPTIRSLNLGSNKIGAQGASDIGRALLVNSVLNYLNLSENMIEDEGMLSIWGALSTNSTLTRISLNNCNIGDKGAFAVATALSNNSSIKDIFLRGHKFGALGCLAIAKALATNSTLEQIDLSDNQMGDTAVSEIARWLSKNRTLKAIYLDCNEIKSKGISEIKRVLFTNYTIQHMALSDNKGTSRSDLQYIDHITRLNRVLKNQPAFRMYRDSIPQSCNTDEKVDNYLMELQYSSAPWRSMKTIVLGNGQIGKTTFVNYLTQVLAKNTLSILAAKITKKKKMIESTVGIESSTLKVANGQVTIFDFAGQLEYTVTHQFFLSNQMVVYLVCFDLSAPPEEQSQQINSWLSYLNSLLCDNNKKNHPIQHSKWRVIIAGTRADKQHPQTFLFQNTQIFHQRYPSLPLMDSLFRFSTLHDPKSTEVLFNAIVKQCNYIMNRYAKYIPTYFTDLKKDITLLSSLGTSIIDMSLLPTKWKESPDLTQRALHHLHSIGEIVLFGKDKICSNPEIISKLLAKFISPIEVRTKLGVSSRVNLMQREDMETVLQVTDSSQFDNELQLLSQFGICYELSTKDSIKDFKLYLFPSLSSTALSMQFTLDPNPRYQLKGLEVCAKEGKVFVAGLLCQFIVTLCTELHLFHHEIIKVASNGLLLACAGITDGQLMVFVDPKEMFRTIKFIAMATNPNLFQVTEIFQNMIITKFPTYARYTIQQLCPKCIEVTFVQNRTLDNPMHLESNSSFCSNGHNQIELQQKEQQQPDKQKSAISIQSHTCWTHNVHHHDFFLNYRVSAEGAASGCSTKPLVQELYEALSCQKKKGTADNIFVFWDKKCLNYGQNWQDGFMFGLENAKTLEGVRQNSTNKQDNVLLEYHFFCHLCIFHVDKPRYEYALLKNKSPQKTFVLPVFVGSVKTTQATNLALPNSSSQQQQQGPNQHHFEFERFSIGKQAPFPSGCHVRDSDSQKIIDKLHSEVPTPCNWLSSVSATMAEVFKLQGIHMAERGTKKEMDEVVDVLLKILDKPQII